MYSDIKIHKFRSINGFNSLPAHLTIKFYKIYWMMKNHADSKVCAAIPFINNNFEILTMT